MDDQISSIDERDLDFDLQEVIPTNPVLDETATADQLYRPDPNFPFKKSTDT